MPKQSKNAEDLMVTYGTPEERFDQWRRRAGRIQPDAVVKIMANPDSRQALYRVFAHTEYLARCCLAHPDAVMKSLTGETSEVLSEVARDLRALDRATGPSAALASAIQPLKERAVVAIGLADISGIWTYEEVGASISDLAERILDAGLGWLTRLAYRHGEFTSGEETAPVPLPGLFVLSGGDLAAEEAAYCGPLEIAVVYDPKVLEDLKIGASEQTFSRMVCELTDAFGTLNKQGTIFELVAYRATEARGLKAGNECFALSVEEVRTLLRDHATPFDRAWFAGARVVAGDRSAGGEFVEEVASQIWKEGLNAKEIMQAVLIADEQDAQACGLRRNPSHDAHWRLVQTCRLALGQHHEDFRKGPARSVFATAGEMGAMGQLTADRLGSNFDFYSVARNRMALIRGDASQALETDKKIEDRAALCGFSNPILFETALKGTVAEAEQQWLNIVTQPDTGSFDALGATRDGELSSTQEAKDIGTLEEIGFEEGKVISSTVDGWLKGDFARTGDDAGPRLSALAPGLLTEFAATQNPDRAIANFDRLLRLLPEDEKPFERLREDSALTDSIVDFFGNTARFGEIYVSNKDLASEIFASKSDSPKTVDDWMSTYPAPRRHGGSDQALDALSEWLWEMRARLCFAAVKNEIDFNLAGNILSAVNDAAISLVYEVALADVNAPKGKLGKGLSVVAMGDYGSGNVAVQTPVDLVFVYDPDGEKGASADAVRYYGEVAQKLMQLLTVPRQISESEEVPLFEVDTRCRPGGTSGEIASSVRQYSNYFVGEADARDQLAVTSARVICGPDAMQSRLDELHTEFLIRPRQGERVSKDIDKALTKEFRMHAPSSVWDIDRIRGGFGDLKIVIECLQTQHGGEHPYVLSADMGDSLRALGRAGCIDGPSAADLEESLFFWRSLKTALAFAGNIDPGAERPRQRLAKLLARAAGVSQFSAVEPLIRGHAERTLAHYNQILLGAAPDTTSSSNVA